ncbi:MAG: ABC transporter ATP-binding protein [Clostridiales bacterium]|nr:ABC transporter ATP-binding protein [Clostridiales bacterium]
MSGESAKGQKSYTNALLRLENITKAFGNTKVLNGVSLTVGAGEFLTLLGSSGCGKTTTLRIIAGLERPDSGRVFLEERDITYSEPNKRDVNTVFQNYALFPHMNVESNVGYSLRIRSVNKVEIKQRVADALRLTRMDEYAKRMPTELSGGQMQRVAIARAIINRPKLLLLDEPLGALDLQLRRRMQIELKRLQRELGIAFIYITHDQEEALNMSDRIAVIRGGLLEQTGGAAEIYDAPRTSYVARFVGSANILRGVSALSSLLPNEIIAVRGENIVMEPYSEQSRGLKGVVTDKRFAGGMLRISARLNQSGAEVVSSRHGIDSPLTPGQSVSVSWDAASEIVVKDNDTGEVS